MVYCRNRCPVDGESSSRCSSGSALPSMRARLFTSNSSSSALPMGLCKPRDPSSSSSRGAEKRGTGLESSECCDDTCDEP